LSPGRKAFSPLRADIDFPDTAPGAPTGARFRARFDQPVAVIEAWTLSDVIPAIEQVQAHALAGRWCVGGLSYEAAAAFDAAFITQPPDPAWPLVWFGIYAEPLDSPPPAPGPMGEARWAMNASRAQYIAQARAAQQAMAAGECYQINFTAAWEGVLQGAPAAWMQALRERQPDGYLLWLEGSDRQVLSASPELFFDWRPNDQGGALRCRPMKGTAEREADPALDAAARERLLASSKEQAENVMIVDLLRNDLNRIAQPGSVRVDRLMEAEAWPTVWQMTSSISARARVGLGLSDVFRALFPCGSITGAPKVQAMRWITQLEPGARSLYCGAMGMVRPGGHATFNVPIRTLTLQSPEDTAPPIWQARYGVGSGLTVYAEPMAEWEELMSKSQLLHRASEPFRLLETLRLENGVFARLERHLQRISDSARHFGYACNPAWLKANLEQLLASGHGDGLWRVRMMLDAQGTIETQAFAMQDSPKTVRVALAPEALDTRAALKEFIAHKTTRRAHYESLAPTSPEVFDHILFNEQGELTEFTRGNLAVRLNGQWLTPLLSCGLLGGTYRAELLEEGRLREAVITREDLENAEDVAFFNGLRGWLKAVLDTAP
jgi:para-aminobenzoate synthetase/4-amino-4-deoxychorismate lyase